MATSDRRHESNPGEQLAMRAAEALIEQIVASSGVPSRKRRLEIARELRSHVLDFVSNAARIDGQLDDEIEKNGSRQLG